MIDLVSEEERVSHLTGQGFEELLSNLDDENPADLCDRYSELSDQYLVNQLQELLKEFGIGILRVEDINPEKGELTVTVSEDLDCSGLPDNGVEFCTYDEGFICGLLEAFTGKAFTVTAIDCWCTGDRTCRFQARAQDKAE